MSNNGKTFLAWKVEWKEKNEELRKKYNLPCGLGQTWECFDGCPSGCYKGGDSGRCYGCYILHDAQKMMKEYWIQ